MKDKNENIDLVLLEKGILTEIKKIEISKLEKEIELEKIKFSSKKEPIQKGILIALVGLIATLLGTIADGIYSRIVERDKFESNLIINAVRKDNVKDRLEELQFLISANLISTDNYKNIDAIINADINERPLLLQEFENANYSNIESVFGLKSKFNKFDYEINDNELIIEINGLSFTQFELRGDGSKVTTISKIVAGITYETDSIGNWDILSESNPYIVDKSIKVGEKHEIDSVTFSIDLTKSQKNKDYPLVLIVYEYSGEDKFSEGYSIIDITEIRL